MQQDTTAPTMESQVDWKNLWGLELEQANCSLCDASYLLPEAMARFGQEPCPNCSRAFLEVAEKTVAQPDFARAPELVVEFLVEPAQAVDLMMRFVKQIKQPPPDITKQNLADRLRRVYLPVWLVDATVQAQWGMDVGFDYDVVSHQERHVDGKWVSQEVKKNRVEWEPRVGLMERRYDNIHAAALDGYFNLEKQVKAFDEKTAVPYQADQLSQAYILLPDRATDDAWNDAEVGMLQRGKADALAAVEAHHNRDFKWSPQYSDKNWTLLLVPLYTSYYLDDDRMPHVLFVNGQRGGINGALKASEKQARRFVIPTTIVAFVVVALSLIVGAVGILSGLLPVALISVLGVLFAIMLVVLAFAPVASATMFNRKYDQLRVFFKPYRPELNKTLGK